MIVARVCIVCQKPFSYDHATRGRYRATCSPQCRATREREQGRTYRRQGRYPARPRAKTIPKVCAVCSKPFMAAVRKRQACGPVCGNILGKRNGDAGRRLAAEQRRRRICEGCRVEFVMRNPSGAARAGRAREGRFCSRDCLATSRRPRSESAE